MSTTSAVEDVLADIDLLRIILGQLPLDALFELNCRGGFNSLSRRVLGSMTGLFWYWGKCARCASGSRSGSRSGCLIVKRGTKLEAVKHATAAGCNLEFTSGEVPEGVISYLLETDPQGQCYFGDIYVKPVTFTVDAAELDIMLRQSHNWWPHIGAQVQLRDMTAGDYIRRVYSMDPVLAASRADSLFECRHTPMDVLEAIVTADNVQQAMFHPNFSDKLIRKFSGEIDVAELVEMGFCVPADVLVARAADVNWEYFHGHPDYSLENLKMLEPYIEWSVILSISEEAADYYIDRLNLDNITLSNFSAEFILRHKARLRSDVNIYINRSASSERYIGLAAVSSLINIVYCDNDDLLL